MSWILSPARPAGPWKGGPVLDKVAVLSLYVAPALSQSGVMKSQQAVRLDNKWYYVQNSISQLWGECFFPIPPHRT